MNTNTVNSVSMLYVNKILCCYNNKIKKIFVPNCVNVCELMLCKLVLPDLQSGEMDPKMFAKSLHARRKCSKQIKSHKFKVKTLLEIMCKHDSQSSNMGRRLENKQYNNVDTLVLSDLHTGPLQRIRQYISGEERSLVYHLDKFVSLVVALRYSANLAQFASILNLYLGIYYDESLIQQIFSYFEQVFGFECKDNISSMEFQNGTLDTIRDLMGKWKSIQTSETAMKLYKFISMILTVGLCKINGISFSLRGLRIFHMEAEKRVYDLQDIVEVCFETVTYFYDRGCDAFENKDIWRLFYSDDKLLEYEKEFTFLVASAPIVEVNNWEELGCTIQEFELRLDNHFILTNEMIKGSPLGQYRNVLNGKLLALQKVKTKLMMSKRNTSLRVKPFSVLLYGKTGVGKSTMLDYLINYLSKVNGFPVGPEYKCTLNPSDQYDSSYHSTAISVIMDDIANSTPQATTGNPCLKVIDYINNDPKDALKADVDSKGNVKIQPKFVFGTTNKKSLDAHVYSNEPASISRRFDYVITVKVKDEFQKDDSAQLDGEKLPQGVVPDVWDFCVETVVPIPNEAGGPDTVSYAYAKRGEEILNSCSFGVLLDFLGKKSIRHFNTQNNMLKHISGINKMEMCKHCGNYSDLCKHDQNIVLTQLQNGPIFRKKDWCTEIPKPETWHDKWLDRLDFKISSIPLFPGLIIGLQEQQISWAADGCKFMFGYLWAKSKCLAIALSIPLCLLYGFLLFFVSPFYYGSLTALLCGLAIDKKMSFLADSLVRTAEKTKLYKVAERHRAGINKGVKIAGYGVISAATFVTLRLIYRKYKQLSDLQGSEEKVPLPHDHEKVNVWKQTPIIPLDYTLKSKTTTYDQLISEVSKVVCHCTAFEPDTGRKFVSDIFPVGNNIWVMNGHAIRGEILELSIITHDPEMVGGNFKTMVSPINCHFIEDSDLVFMYLPCGGDRKNLSQYFPKKWLDISCESALVYKSVEGDATYQSLHCVSKNTEVGDMRCKSYAYNTLKPTFPGQCMSVLIANLRHPMIVGFHFAGNTGSKIGAATYVTSSMVEQARIALAKIPGTLLSAHTGDFTLSDIDRYKNVRMLGCNHYKSPTQFIDGESVFKNYGAHNGPRRTFNSSVIKTMISDSVEKVMKVKIAHGPPKNMNTWKPWKVAFDNYTETHILDQGLISVSTQDFILGSCESVSNDTYENTHPLDDVSMLSGADGVYGIDSVNMSSGAGHPFNCPKTDIFTRSDEPSTTHNSPIEAPEWFFDEVRRREEVLSNGERCYSIFKGHLKDEATKLTKDKVRLFTGSDIVTLAMVRKYFLPLCKIVMDNPYTFECAVGINAHGPEWDEFTKRVTKFGNTRMVAGDYKAFDATMPASLTLASFSIFMHMAKKCGYSERQLEIMRGLATEICYPIYEFNGEFIGINGTNPSGHPLTVFINSFANSLYLRYAFYYISEPKPGKLFKDYVSLQCYGDDNIFSVSKELPEYNHTSISNALAQYGVVYTMAEKDQPSIPYIPLADCTFLKRRMVYNSEVDLFLGPLEEASLFKTLHCVVKSDVLNTRQQAAECIKSTLQEWFLHGKKLYDERRTQLLEVISINNLQECFSANLPTYEESMIKFRCKYLGEQIPENPVSDPLVGEILYLEF